MQIEGGNCHHDDVDDDMKENCGVVVRPGVLQQHKVEGRRRGDGVLRPVVGASFDCLVLLLLLLVVVCSGSGSGNGAA